MQQSAKIFVSGTLLAIVMSPASALSQTTPSDGFGTMAPRAATEMTEREYRIMQEHQENVRLFRQLEEIARENRRKLEEANRKMCRVAEVIVANASARLPTGAAPMDPVNVEAARQQLMSCR